MKKKEIVEESLKMTPALRATILGLLTTGKKESEIAAILGIPLTSLEKLYINNDEWKAAFNEINPYQLLGECMIVIQNILSGTSYKTSVVVEEKSGIIRDANGTPLLTVDGQVQYTPVGKTVKTSTEQITPRLPDAISLAADLNKAIKQVENKRVDPLIDDGKWRAIEEELRKDGG
jgi:hypothetical protein